MHNEGLLYYVTVCTVSINTNHVHTVRGRERWSNVGATEEDNSVWVRSQ